MEFLLLAVIIGLIPAYIARNKGRSFGLWWFFGAALFIVALPCALIMKPDNASLEKQQLEGEMKKCPFCAEMIKAEAIVCRCCGRDVINEKKRLINDKKKTLNFSTPEACQSSLKELAVYAGTIAYDNIELERDEITALADKLDKESRTFKGVTYDSYASMQETKVAADAHDKKRHQFVIKTLGIILVAIGILVIMSIISTSEWWRLNAYFKGTVLDTKTNLMWANTDNGEDINWQDAKDYCKNYRGGSYTDWRMPSQNELAGLYAAGIHKDKIKITNNGYWALETRDSDAVKFWFIDGTWYWNPQASNHTARALPVRSAKQIIR